MEGRRIGDILARRRNMRYIRRKEDRRYIGRKEDRRYIGRKEEYEIYRKEGGI